MDIAAPNAREAGNSAVTTITVILTKTISVTAPGTPITSASIEKNTVALGSSGPLMTIAITNEYGSQLSVSFGSNAGAPSAVGNPSATTLAKNGATSYTFPTGWAGRVYLGPNLNSDGSKIEGSYTGPPDIDISFVDGYSVPITCSSQGVPVTGCNIELFEQSGIICTNKVDGPVCLNSAQNIPDGPAPSFFAACAGAAYTYPKDDKANISNLNSTLVSCCVGTSCKAPLRQPKLGSASRPPIKMRTVRSLRKSKNPMALPYRSPKRYYRHFRGSVIQA